MLRERILQYFGRHLVALCVTSQQSDGIIRFKTYCGTLLKIDDTILWLTAGHIVREIEVALKSDQATIIESVLSDFFGHRYVSTMPIPIALKDCPRFFCDDDDGLDFGAIMLHVHYVRLLSANGVVILSEENWIKQNSIEYIGYCMLGIPEEFTSELNPRDDFVLVSPAMITVRSLEHEPEGHKLGSPRFTASIVDPIPMSSLSGMSGGPIFGFAGNEQELRYWIVAIQSSWLAEKRMTFGCPLPVFCPLLTDWVRSYASFSE